MFGVDYASVDGNNPPDWAAAKASGLTFVIARGAYGVYHDPIMPRDWDAIRRAGLVRGAYLFLRYMKDGVTPEDQVKAFEAAIPGGFASTDFAPALDVEFPGGLAATGMTAAEAIAWTTRAWRAMVDTFGVAPMIYTSARVWAEDLHNPMIQELLESAPWLAKPWPWAVRSPARLRWPYTGGDFDPTVPPMWGRQNWWIHQYQGDALRCPGFTATVDLNRFHDLACGETSTRVTWMLRRLGPIERIDPMQAATFDAFTATRVREFQRAWHLVDDGIVGVRTFAALSWCRPAA